MRIFSATDIGQKRKMNQDYLFVSEEPLGNLPNLFVVADGMGGHNAGDFASSHAVQKLVDEIETEIFNREEREISARKIGEIVMNRLKNLDAVAYVRFASVYREFKDVSTFMDEIMKIMETKEK